MSTGEGHALGLASRHGSTLTGEGGGTPVTLAASYDALVAETQAASDRISTTVYSLARRAHDTLRRILGSVPSAGVEAETEVTAMVVAHLIDPIRLYLALPAHLREDGGEADRSLITQYTTLLTEVTRLTARIERQQLDAVRTNARFIADTFED